MKIFPQKRENGVDASCTPLSTNQSNSKPMRIICLNCEHRLISHELNIFVLLVLLSLAVVVVSFMNFVEDKAKKI